MDINSIGQLVATLGFPIVAAAALFWLVIKQNENHSEEMNALRDSLEKNTIVLTELKELISYMTKGLKNDSEKGN